MPRFERCITVMLRNYPVCSFGTSATPCGGSAGICGGFRRGKADAGGQKKPRVRCEPRASGKWRRPTLPRVCSTIGATVLNFSVRNGKRWNHSAVTTGNILLDFFFTATMLESLCLNPSSVKKGNTVSSNPACGISHVPTLIYLYIYHIHI